MLKNLIKSLCLAAAIALPVTATTASAEKKESFKVCWSIYVGWMPWGYLSDSGIMKKWADKYGITVDIVQINDYVESINQYTAGEYDGCSMTNMDALSIPAGGGVDTTALIVGDYSNGNDAIILKDKSDLKDIAGQNVNLVELSVSHYLLARALESVGLAESVTEPSLAKLPLSMSAATMEALPLASSWTVMSWQLAVGGWQAGPPSVIVQLKLSINNWRSAAAVQY